MEKETIGIIAFILALIQFVLLILLSRGMRATKKEKFDMTEEQKQLLMSALEYLWIFGTGRHPAPARALIALWLAFGMDKEAGMRLFKS